MFPSLPTYCAAQIEALASSATVILLVLLFLLVLLVLLVFLVLLVLLVALLIVLLLLLVRFVLFAAATFRIVPDSHAVRITPRCTATFDRLQPEQAVIRRRRISVAARVGSAQIWALSAFPSVICVLRIPAREGHTLPTAEIFTHVTITVASP